MHGPEYSFRPLCAAFVSILLIVGTDRQRESDSLIDNAISAGPLFIAEPVHEFGEVWKGERIRHGFLVENRSDEIVWFKMSWSGLWGWKPHYRIQPNSSTYIQFDMGTKNWRRGGRLNKNLTLRMIDNPYLDFCDLCNAQAHPITQIGLMREPCHQWSYSKSLRLVNNLDNTATAMVNWIKKRVKQATKKQKKSRKP